MRYLPLTDADRSAMLGVIGAASVDDLFRDVPRSVWLDEPPALPRAMGEIEVERALMRLAAKNVPASAVPSFLGCGVYRHHVPAAVDHLIQRGEFLTSYTPYQPEVSQGTLQSMFEFQTQVALITAMDVANASMYDGATSCAEAVMMANRLTRRRKAILAGDLHPHYREAAATYARFGDFSVVTRPAGPAGENDLAALASKIDGETSCVVVQNPGSFGDVRDLSLLAEACHRAGALLVVVVAEAVSLGLVKPPGEMGADIVAAEGQSLGNAPGFGGPHLGLFAVREKFVRQMPGRVVGETRDVEGRRGFVLTLSTREQHIRREKATSNICTNSGLCALAFTIHMALLGEAGFTRLAELNHARAALLADRLAALPRLRVLTRCFFNELTVRLPVPAAPVVDMLAARGVLAGVPASRLWPERADLADLLILAATELNTEDDIATLTAGLREVLS
ncbi:MAG TPA: aminomethyl-transferring glycine dehydrogenase subunit GcvPA [Stellaceae bacterium]|nr:aminomethyl-transferring glycine dehydrogenase subunit GcvPA [Stellaceae bacterium]